MNRTGRLRQTKFDVETTVIGLYLNLLTAERLRMVMQDNVERISRLREIIIARTMNGLNPGVDSSIANAELLDSQNVVDRCGKF
jgi:hypothetical protein